MGVRLPVTRDRNTGISRTRACRDGRAGLKRVRPLEILGVEVGGLARNQRVQRGGHFKSTRNRFFC